MEILIASSASAAVVAALSFVLGVLKRRRVDLRALGEVAAHEALLRGGSDVLGVVGRWVALVAGQLGPRATPARVREAAIAALPLLLGGLVGGADRVSRSFAPPPPDPTDPAPCPDCGERRSVPVGPDRGERAVEAVP